MSDKRAEAARRRLTDIQEVVLRKVVEHGGKMLSAELNAWLYDSEHNKSWMSLRWASRGEAAQTYIAALVKKGYLVRPARGVVEVTDEGRERVSA